MTQPGEKIKVYEDLSDMIGKVTIMGDVLNYFKDKESKEGRIFLEGLEARSQELIIIKQKAEVDEKTNK